MPVPLKNIYKVVLTKFISWKFIKVSTFTFIPFAAFGFLWHNNLFPSIYYASSIFLNTETQNVWPMNFAMALQVYGMTYFFFRSLKPDTDLLTAFLWGMYYNISVVGFFQFLTLGLIKDWSFALVVWDLVWAVVSGGLAGMMIRYLYKRF